MNDPETECIVMIGEIGGQLEADAAHWIKADGNQASSRIHRRSYRSSRSYNGHAGAIVGGTDDTAEAKKQIMRECGIHVVDSPAEIGKKSKRSFRIVRYFKLKDKKALTFWGFLLLIELKYLAAY
jgi:succinyl-CoA synthetase alpha subunit